MIPDVIRTCCGSSQPSAFPRVRLGCRPSTPIFLYISQLYTVAMSCGASESSVGVGPCSDQLDGRVYHTLPMNVSSRCRQPYQCLEQGSVALRRDAVLPGGSVPSRARFVRGDACALDTEALGLFDAVVASNILCRCVAKRFRLGRVL